MNITRCVLITVGLLRNANIDALFEKGNIKRIKKRQEMRSNYYPSIKRSEEMTQKNAFGRGDMKK